MIDELDYQGKTQREQLIRLMAESLEIEGCENIRIGIEGEPNQPDMIQGMVQNWPPDLTATRPWGKHVIMAVEMAEGCVASLNDLRNRLQLFNSAASALTAELHVAIPATMGGKSTTATMNALLKTMNINAKLWVLGGA